MGDHAGEDVKGRLKKAVGDLTGDKALGREGKIDQASAAIKRQVDSGVDKLKDAVRPKPREDKPADD